MVAAMFLLLALMLISASSMFDLHVLVVGFVMFNILKLIIEIVPNYPTVWPVPFSFPYAAGQQFYSCIHRLALLAS